MLNLGGVGNITWFGGTGDARPWGSFDTGPANALIDDWVRAADRRAATTPAGRWRRRGASTRRSSPRCSTCRGSTCRGPKSLDRADFGLGAVRGLSTADGAATLTAFTAATVAQALSHVAERPARLLVTGGGRHNPTLMAMLGRRTGVPVAPVEAVGWNGDALEAEAFAYLAVRVLAGQPTSWPETTGVRRRRRFRRGQSDRPPRRRTPAGGYRLAFPRGDTRRAQPLVQIPIHHLHQVGHLMLEEVVRLGHRRVVDRDVALGLQLVDELLDARCRRRPRRSRRR